MHRCGYVRAYDLNTGSLLWDRRVNRLSGADTAKVVAARGGRVFVGGYLWEEVGQFNFALLAFDARTGALLWEQVVDSGMDRWDAAWSVTAAADRVFVSGDVRDSSTLLIRAHAARTGAVLWEKEVPGASNLVAEEDALAAHANLVFSSAVLADGDFLVQAYDARTGRLEWSDRAEAGDRISQSIELAVAGNRLFAAAVFDCDPETFVECKLTVRAYNARTGALLWHDVNQSTGNDWYVNGIVAAKGHAFVSGARMNTAGDYECAILAYNAKTGSLAWEESFDGGGDAFESVMDLLWDGGRLFALGQMSSPSKHSDVFVRAYRIGSDGEDEAGADH
jgi:outer membrane protein assembly factor BamB